MPYVSKAQSRFMHSQHPDIAARWDKEYPNQKGLPERVSVKRRPHGSCVFSNADIAQGFHRVEGE